MADYHHRPINKAQLTAGRIALLVVILALIGNVAAFAWMRPYSILRDLGPLAEARELIHGLYVDEVDNQKLLDGSIQGMMTALGDANSQYLDQKRYDAFKDHFRGEFSGIGAEVGIFEDHLMIISPMDDSPAMKAGLMPGDIVLEVEGKSTKGVPITDAVEMIKGKDGTKVKLKVRHPDGELADITITRGKIKVNSIRGYRRDPGNGYQYMIDPKRKIAYVHLTQFADKSSDELASRLKALQGKGMKGLVLDMRDNPGGLLTAAVEISDMFLGKGKTIVSTKGRKESASKVVSTADVLLPELPVVVLINENSASASEIVAGALADNDRALLVGTRSFGKGSVQQLRELSGGKQAIKLTTAYWYMPSGRLIHKKEGATEWGVDPSPGCFVVMDDEHVRQMVLKQRKNAATDPYAALDGPITPQWIRKEILDLQLAAGLEAMQAKLDGKDWPKVGISKAKALAKPTERQTLVKQREQLERMIKDLDKKLKKLDEKTP